MGVDQRHHVAPTGSVLESASRQDLAAGQPHPARVVVVHWIRAGHHHCATAGATGPVGEAVPGRQDHGTGHYTAVRENGAGALGVTLGDQQCDHRRTLARQHPTSRNRQQDCVGLQDLLRRFPVDRQAHSLRVLATSHGSILEAVS